LLPATLRAGGRHGAEDLATRVQQLENRVAELEKLIKQMQAQAKEPAKSTTEQKLVGNWAVGDDERKVEGVITDLRLKPDGTAKAVLNTPDGRWNNIKYDVVGKQLQLGENRGHATYSLAVRIHSIMDTQLILEYMVGQKLRPIRYTRE
jgi:hypothetical protein